ncbi:hypothetical protein NECAME_04804 [Necator americanus]|uniref:MADF domain-containing protein n=1 Tax=Necator americanus TaxID=51031 RepID=W2SPM9_NECAM|nr:hypothetical protein NECAME_04804 [Necator americanus]ETN70791.1 hypothetical protein NECAME_04804 [Necator americanus]
MPKCSDDFSHFTEDDKFYLIDLVQERKVLWLEDHCDYKNSAVRMRKWHEIQQAFSHKGKQIPIIELQKHWRTLRDTYVRKQRYMKEALQQPNGAESRVTRRIMAWPFYERMVFLTLFAGENSSSRRSRSSPKREPECSPKLELPCSSEKEEKQTKDGDHALSVLEAFARDFNSHTVPPPGDEWDILGASLSIRLRELAVSDRVKAQEYRLEVDQLILNIGKSIIECARASQ